MKITIGLMTVNVAALFMLSVAIVSASDIDRGQLILLMSNTSKATTEDIKRAKEIYKMSIESYMSYRAEEEADSLIIMAKKSPFDINAIADAAIRLKTSGFNLESLQTIVDGVAHFGGNSNNLHQAAFAIQQMVTKRQVSMEEINQLNEVIPNASELMARGLSMTMNDFLKVVSQGILNSKEALKLMFRDMEIDFSGQGAEEMMKASQK